MARETWKCPYVDCKQECTRKWNLQRHILGIHGEGKPVKNKPSANTAWSTWDIQGTANIFKNRYTSNPNSPYSLPSQYYDPSAIEWIHPGSQSAKEGNNKTGQKEKATGEVDFVDIAYPIYKKWKDRIDKFEEMINYFANNNSRILFSSYFPLDIFNYGKLNNMPPYHLRSEFCSLPVSSLSPPQVDKVQPKKVIGYVGVICSNCLESESLKVMYDPHTGDKIYRTQHICDPQNIDSVKRYPRPKHESLLCVFKILGLSEHVTRTVKEWTKGGEVFLIPYKIDSSNVTKNTITLNVGRNQYNWLIRAILQKHTVLNDEELNEFLFLTYNSTFCHLRINFVEGEEQQTMKQEFYFLFLNYKPSLPFEN
jgi:hypothetical protein